MHIIRMRLLQKRGRKWW